MNNFPKLYVIVSALWVCAMGVDAFAKQPFLGVVLVCAWVGWNFFAMFKFQKTNVPFTAPMLFFLMIATMFECAAVAAVASQPLQMVLLGVGVLGALGLFVAHIVVSKSLVLHDYEIDVKSAAPASLPSGKKRVAAALIDGLIMAVSSTVILCLSGLVVHAFVLPGRALNAWALMPIALPGAFFGLATPVAAVTNLLCCIAGSTHLDGIPGTSKITMATAYGSIGLANLFAVLYFSLLESSSWQATVGKRAMGLRVTDLAGQRLTVARSLLRTGLKTVSLGSFFLGFIYALFSPKRQGFHDILAKTLIVPATAGYIDAERPAIILPRRVD